MIKYAVAVSLSLTLLLGCGREPEPARQSEAITLDKMKQRTKAHLDRAMDRINATEVQREQIQKMVEELLAKGMTLRSTHKDARKKLLEQWDAPKADRKAVHQIVDKQLDELRTFIHLAVDRIVDLHEILTPEQRALIRQKVDQLHAMKVKHKPCWFKHHGFGGTK